MSGGLENLERKERIRKNKATQRVREKLAKILDDYKWVIVDDLVECLESEEE